MTPTRLTSARRAALTIAALTGTAWVSNETGAGHHAGATAPRRRNRVYWSTADWLCANRYAIRSLHPDGVTIQLTHEGWELARSEGVLP